MNPVRSPNSRAATSRCVLVRRGITPPLCCGLLDGVMRHLLLAQGRLVERMIRREELDSAEALAFLNALRGWVPVVLIQWEENDGPGRGE